MKGILTPKTTLKDPNILDGITDASAARQALSVPAVPVAVPDGGTGGKTPLAALQNLGLAYKVNDTITFKSARQAGGLISGGTTKVLFTVYPDQRLDAISHITLTSFQAEIRTTNGTYINGTSYGLIEYAGNSEYTVTASKVSNNAFQVSLVKSTAFTSVSNNTPLAINYTLTAKLT